MNKLVIIYDCANHGWSAGQIADMLGHDTQTLKEIDGAFAKINDHDGFWGLLEPPRASSVWIKNNRERVNATKRANYAKKKALKFPKIEGVM